MYRCILLSFWLAVLLAASAQCHENANEIANANVFSSYKAWVQSVTSGERGGFVDDKKAIRLLGKLSTLEKELAPLIKDRNWISVDGKHRVVGDLVSFSLDEVVLFDPESKETITAERWRLSRDNNLALDRINEIYREYILKCYELLGYAAKIEGVFFFPDEQLQPLPVKNNGPDKWQMLSGEVIESPFRNMAESISDGKTKVHFENRATADLDDFDEHQKAILKRLKHYSECRKKEETRNRGFERKLKEIDLVSRQSLSDRFWPDFAQQNRKYIEQVGEWRSKFGDEQRERYVRTQARCLLVIRAYVRGEPESALEYYTLAKHDAYAPASDLFDYTEFGSILMKDAAGPGMHLTYKEIWTLIENEL